MGLLNWLFGRKRVAAPEPERQEPALPGSVTVTIHAPPIVVKRVEAPESRPTGWKAAEEENRAALRRYYAEGNYPAPTKPETKAVQIEQPSPVIPVDKDFRFIALDVETANSWSGSICQIGLACVSRDGEITCQSFFVDPEQHFDDFNVRLTGISATTVRGAPTFRQIFPGLREMLKRQPVIQHSTFDSRAIAAAAENARQVSAGIHWMDSVQIARKAWPEFIGNGGHGLSHLKSKLQLDFQHHDAGEDARAAAQVVLRAEGVLGLPFRDILQKSARRKRAVTTGTAEVNTAGRLAGHVAVFTGMLPITRNAAEDLAAELGIVTVKAVSKKVTLLIVGDQDPSVLAGHTKSASHRKAEDLIAQGHDIQIIDARAFLELVDRG